MTVSTVVATRLRSRALPSGHVPRPHLYDRLGPGTGAKVTLVSAPPGSGKTTLVREWLAQRPPQSWVWLSLSPSENEPALFWRALIDSVRTIRPSLGEEDLQALLHAGTAPDEAMLTLLDGLAEPENAVPTAFIIVLEDVHRTGCVEVHRSLALFIEHLPENVHLVITSRVDPAIPIALLRARGELVEIRAKDLSFNDREAVELMRASGFDHIDDASARALNQRAEGWVVGLRLAGNALQHADDDNEFLRSFGGWENSIAEFLLDEVMRGLSPDVRQFLIDTSIVGAVTPSLAHAITSRTDSAELLRTMANGHIFVDRLEGGGQWYHYHQLFNDLLRLEARSQGIEAYRGLHRRAADWYEAAQRPAEALEHALQAVDEERTVELVLAHHFTLLRDGKVALVRAAVELISDSFVLANTERTMGYVEALAFAGLADSALDLLDRLERMVEHGERDARARVALMRCMVASIEGDLATARTYLDSVTDLIGRIPSNEIGLRARLNLARVLRLGECYDEARLVVETIVHTPRCPALVIAAANGVLAEVELETGDLLGGARRAREAVELWRNTGAPVQVAIIDGLRALAMAQFESGDVGGAMDLLNEALQQSAYFVPGTPRLSTLIQLGLLEAWTARTDTALARIREGQARWGALVPGSEMQARVLETEAAIYIRLGALPEAERCLAQGDALSASGGSRRPALGAELCLAAGRPQEALDVLATSLPTTNAPSLQAALLRAQAHSQLGDVAAARHQVELALSKGLPAGYRMTFALRIDLLPLYEAVQRNTPSPDLANVITLAKRGNAAAALRGTPELLSGRELQLLRLLPTHLSNPELAVELYVSLNTVKSHLRNIYRKLFVTSRSEAVARARELGLLA